MAAKLSVPESVGMKELLEDTSLCKGIARNKEGLKSIICQIQLDIANEDNRDIVGPTIIALKNLQDIILLFSAKGDLLISQEKEKENKTP